MSAKEYIDEVLKLFGAGSAAGAVVWYFIKRGPAKDKADLTLTEQQGKKTQWEGDLAKMNLLDMVNTRVKLEKDKIGAVLLEESILHLEEKARWRQQMEESNKKIIALELHVSELKNMVEKLTMRVNSTT